MLERIRLACGGGIIAVCVGHLLGAPRSIPSDCVAALIGLALAFCWLRRFHIHEGAGE